MSSLQEQIATRIKQAEEEKIDSKAATIMRNLGDWYNDVPVQDGWKRGGSYTDKRFQMETSLTVMNDGGAGAHTKIVYNGEVVFEEAGFKLKIFKPNKRGWQRVFEKLYAKAQVEEEAQKEERAEQHAKKSAVEEAELRENFAL